MKKDNEETTEERTDRICKPHFDKALQERKSNSMTTIQPIYKIFWRPNNYRRKIEIKEWDSSTMKKIASAIGSAIQKKDFNYSSHTKLVFVKNFKGVTIQLGKRTLTGIYSQKIIEGEKEIYLIRAYSTDDLEERINQIKDDIRRKTDEALRIFCKAFDIEEISEPKWDRYEDFIKGEEFIDKIPPSTIVHDTYFKKVYGKGIEFKQTEKKEEPTVNLKNYIVNQATKRHSPEIAKSIEYLGNALLNNLNPSIDRLTEQIQVHLQVQRDTLEVNKINKNTQKAMQKTLKKISSSLSKKPKRKQMKKKTGYGLSEKEQNILRAI